MDLSQAQNGEPYAMFPLIKLAKKLKDKKTPWRWEDHKKVSIN